MYPVSQWLWFKSQSINEVTSRWRSKQSKSSEGSLWSMGLPGTSIIDISANFGDILSKICPDVCERNTWIQYFHVIFFTPYFSTAYTSSSYIKRVSLTIYVWKELNVICSDKLSFQMCVRLVEHKFTDLIFVYFGQALMDLLALISISSPEMWLRSAAVRLRDISRVRRNLTEVKISAVAFSALKWDNMTVQWLYWPGVCASQSYTS